MTRPSFQIHLDQRRIASHVQEIETSTLFQCLVAIRELALSEEETGLLFEVARRGEVAQGDLLTLASEAALTRLGQAGYLVARETLTGPVYRVSPRLNPPRPITAADAADIRRKLTEAGRQGFLEAYIRELVATQGAAGLAVVGRIMAEKGAQLGDQIAEVQGQGPRIVGLRFLELMKALGAPLTLISATDEAVRFRVEHCAYNLQSGEGVLCDTVSALDQAVLRKLGCAIVYEQSVAQGDAVCEGVIRRL